jgi:hypothetical protein
VGVIRCTAWPRRSPPVLTGLRLPEPDVQSVDALQGDVYTHEVGELASANSLRRTPAVGLRSCGVRGPLRRNLGSGPCGLNEELDVIDQQRIPRDAGRFTAAYSGRISDRIAVTSSCARRQTAGGAVLVVDRGDPDAEGGGGVGPLPRLGGGVGSVDEIRSDRDRMCRQRNVRFPLAPAGEASPSGGVGTPRALVTCKGSGHV